MRKTIVRLVPIVLAAVTFASATARAEEGPRHEFKPRWNKHFVKLFNPSLEEDCDQAGRRLAACVQEKTEEYQKDPEALGECTLGQDRCAYEACVESLEIAQMTCGFIQKDSEIANALTRWKDQPAESWWKKAAKAIAIRKPAYSRPVTVETRSLKDFTRDWALPDPSHPEILKDGECGAQYRKVESGESGILDRVLKMCTDLAPTGAGPLVMTPKGLSLVTNGSLCIHEGPVPSDVQCPDEFPQLMGIPDVWYGCVRPSSAPPLQIDRSQVSCIDGYHLKYFFEGSIYFCVNDRDDYGDLADKAETVCGDPSSEILFAGFTENPSMVHCCAQRRFPQEDNPRETQDCDLKAAETLGACIPQKVEEYQKDAAALGDCTASRLQCAYEECIPSAEMAHTECSFYQVKSNILRSGRW